MGRNHLAGSRGDAANGSLIGDVTGRTDSLFRERSHDAILANLAGKTYCGNLTARIMDDPTDYQL